jgi:hypothetical protein
MMELPNEEKVGGFNGLTR